MLTAVPFFSTRGMVLRAILDYQAFGQEELYLAGSMYRERETKVVEENVFLFDVLLTGSVRTRDVCDLKWKTNNLSSSPSFIVSAYADERALPKSSAVVYLF